MLKKLENYQNLIILLIATVVFLSPFVVNYSNLPKGYELAKVHFINFSSALITIVFLIGLLTHKLKFSLKRLKNVVIILVGLLILYLIATIFSDYKDISLIGNYFREQGLIFYSLITIVAAIAYLCINKSNQIFVTWALFLSAVIQSLVGISQYSKLLQTRPELIDDGYWINGNFGQANFYSTLLVLGFVCGIFLLNLALSKRNRTKYIYMFGLFIGVILIVIANIISYSLFGWITMGIAFIILLSYKFLNKIIFYKIFLIGLVISVICGMFVLSKVENNLRLDIWESSITLFFKQIITNPLHFIFGFGFDTLGKVFKDAGLFAGATVDRGHNIFVDVFMQTGVIAIGLCIYLITIILRKIKTISQDSSLFILFFLVFMFTLKTFVHEFSAVQTYLIFMLVAILLGRLNQQQEHLDSN
jgi:hypothetical protein